MTLDIADAERLRGELRSFLGVNSPPAPPDVEVVSSSQEDGFARHLVHLITEDDIIPSLLAVPSGAGPFPAVVVFHQHAGQRHFGKSEVFGLVGEEFQAFGPALARAGFVVLALTPPRSRIAAPVVQAPSPGMTTGISTTTLWPAAWSLVTP